MSKRHRQYNKHTQRTNNKKKTRAPHVDANAQLQLLLENSKSKKGCNYVKRNLRITSPSGLGSSFDSKQPV